MFVVIVFSEAEWRDDRGHKQYGHYVKEVIGPFATYREAWEFLTLFRWDFRDGGWVRAHGNPRYGGGSDFDSAVIHAAL